MTVCENAKEIRLQYCQIKSLDIHRHGTDTFTTVQANGPDSSCEIVTLAAKQTDLDATGEVDAVLFADHTNYRVDEHVFILTTLSSLLPSTPKCLLIEILTCGPSSISFPLSPPRCVCVGAKVSFTPFVLLLLVFTSLQVLSWLSWHCLCSWFTAQLVLSIWAASRGHCGV